MENNYNNEDFNIENDLNNGHIYCIKNKINSKCYIGQALCFTGNNNNRWGSLGRWKSHLREALKNDENHCVLLNNSIRKYGENNFEIYTLIKCHRNELNLNEIEFINKFNSISPNGYNLKTGGDKGKDTQETLDKKKIAHLGVRRDKYKRKYPEDNDLPKYIKSHRESGILIAYVITKFPIGIIKPEYIKDIYFRLSKFTSKELTLNAAINRLNEIKEEYKYINDEVFKEKSIIKPVLTYENKKEKEITSKLPQFIFPLLKENKIYGYYVDNIYDYIGNPFPRKEFTGKTNRWNLNDAKKFVEQLGYFIENKIDIDNFDNLELIDVNRKNLHDNFFLPKYINIYNVKGEMKGFVINGYPCKDYKCGKYKKDFSNQNLTLEENYNKCIEHLEELKLKYPIIKS
jgi:hypothetical protein